MSARTVSVTLNANVSGFVGAMGRAASSVDQFTGKLAGAATKNAAEWDTVGSAMTRVGAVAAAGLGLAAKAAMDWESAFAGVKKTVDGTPEQINRLEGELRGMARTMATSHTEIAAVAEAAGALGVATEDVAGFTRTMIMLGETTNLSATEAADSLAQFMNIMGTAPSQVANLGSALVALGNDGASTEKQILAMGQRIAGAGKTIGLTEADVLGFASAISSVGIEVEAGGTAISSTFLKMEQSVRSGGKELDLMAQTAGMSAAQFKQAFETDAAGAIQAFVEGLGQVAASGGDVTGILNELGITGIREADTLRRLTLAGGLLGDSLSTANTAIQSTSALMDEYGQRAATTESKVKVAWNNIKDAAISAGSVMLPAIAGMATAVAAIAQAFGALPAPVQGFLAVVTAVVAAVGLFGGAAMKAIASLAALRAALVSLGALDAVTGALGKVGPALLNIGKFAVPAAVALGGIGMAIQALKPGPAVSGIDQITDRLRKVAQEGPKAKASLDQLFQTSGGDALVGQVDSLASAFERFGDPAIAERIAHIGESIATLGMADTQLERVTQQFDKLDQVLSTMDPEQAASAFRVLAEQMSQAGVGIEDQIRIFDDYGAKIDEFAQSLGISLSPLEKYQMMLGQIPPRVREAAAANGQASGSFEEIAAAAGAAAMSIQDYADALLAITGGEIAVEQAIAGANEALQENGRNLDLTTEAGRNNMSALKDLASASKDHIATLAEQGASQEEQTAALTRAKTEFENVARAMGMSEGNIKKWSESMFATVSPNLQAAAAARAFAVDAARGSEAAAAMGAALGSIPPSTEVKVTAEGMEPITVQAGKLLEEVSKIPADKMITVTMPNGKEVSGTAAEIQAGIERIMNEKAIRVSAPGAKDAVLSISELGTKLGKIPPNTSVTVTGEGIEPTTGQLSGLMTQLEGIPPDKQIVVTLANGDVLKGTAEQIRTAITQIPDSKDVKATLDITNLEAGTLLAQVAIDSVTGKSVTIDADATGAQLVIQNLAIQLAGIPDDKAVNVRAEGVNETAVGLQGIAQSIQNVPDDKPVTIRLMNGEVVEFTAGQIRDALAQINDKNVSINADASGAVAGAGQAQGAIGAVNGKSVSLIVDPSGAISGSARASASVDTVTGKTVDVNANPAGAISGASQATGAVNNVPNVDRNINVSTNASATASAARSAMNAVQDVVRWITVKLRNESADGGLMVAGMAAAHAGPEHVGAQRFITGGRVAGWSPHPRADNIPAWLTAGEIVQSNAAGDMYGRHRLLALNAGRVDPDDFKAFMRAQGFAGGGAARDAFSRPPTVTLASTSGMTPPMAAASKTVNQEFHYHYPIGERESTATRRAASAAATAATF